MQVTRRTNHASRAVFDRRPGKGPFVPICRQYSPLISGRGLSLSKSPREFFGHQLLEAFWLRMGGMPEYSLTK